MTWAPGKMLRKVFKRNTVKPDPAVEQMTIPASIFLGTTSAEHIAELSRAVDNLINTLDYKIEKKDPPEQGSWFRRLLLAGDPNRADATRAELEALAVHSLEFSPSSSIDETKAQAVGQVLSALQDVPTAVIRLGSMVIIKADDRISVRVLTDAEIQRLDANPAALRDPEKMLSLLTGEDNSKH